ncbi:MAG: M23 family metallopeptidase [Proteobacteria bacterium]|nr:M23 family metallopeptidase [Pseudomonadota bacterium]
MVTSQEIEAFWHALNACVERLKPLAVSRGEWSVLDELQKLERACVLSAGNANPLGLPRIAELKEGLSRLVHLDPEISGLYAFAQHASELLDTPILELSARRENLARRLFSMHRYLDGVSGQEDFGAISADRGEDIHYGIGLGLRNGSLLKFLSRMSQPQDNRPDSVVERCFEEDAPELLDAIGNGQACLEGYFESQLILRYDPILSRKVYALSDSLKARFSRLGAEPEARSAQIDILAGHRFLDAKRHARHAGIESMRGFAMLFDLDKVAGEDVFDEMKSGDAESQKCLSLADSVISRLQGQHAVHWKSRLESVYQGYGCVDGRIYDEIRFLGKNVEHKRWEAPDLVFDDENVYAVPTPGHHYIVSPGDRLSQLTEKAYGAQGDYRFVLRQNPHVQHPEFLMPGTRLYFPEIRQGRADPQKEEVKLPAAVNAEKTSVIYCHREITPMTPMNAEQIEHFCQMLSQLPEEALYQASVVEIPDALALVCQDSTLLITSADNLPEVSQLYGEHESPLKAWLEHLAAQIRGDVVLDNGVKLPFASIPGQMHRNQWAATSLRRVIQDPGLQPLRAVIHSQSFSVDLMDTHDEMVLRLEEADFTAIESMREARLRDFSAPFVSKIAALAQLWVCRALQIPFEIALPPFEHANQYPVSHGDEDVRILVPIGTPVYPIMPGKVVDCGRYPVVGYGILIEHACGICSRYTSLARLNVHSGQYVMPDRVIGRSGSTHLEGQPMLRLEIRRCSNPKDWQGFGGACLNYYDVIHHTWPDSSHIECIIGD